MVLRKRCRGCPKLSSDQIELDVKWKLLHMTGQSKVESLVKAIFGLMTIDGDALSSPVNNMPRYITLVAVGDNTSRKTDLLLRYTYGDRGRPEYLPARFDDYIQDVVIDGKPHLLRIVDTECDEDFKILRWSSYDKADCILMCFSVKNRESFENISAKWCLEVRKRNPLISIILIATEAENLGRVGRQVTKEEGENLRLLIGAFSYIECSSEKTEADKVFIEALRCICHRWNKPASSFELLHIDYQET